jgi:exoribonuclease R
VRTAGIERSWVRPAYRLSYADADDLIDLAPREEEGLARLHDLLERRRGWREARGALRLEQAEGRIRAEGEAARLEIVEPSPSRRMVAEAMVLAGAVIADHGRRLGLPLPFRSQLPAELPPAAALDLLPPGPVRHAAIKRCLGRGHLGSRPAPHFSLGLDAYVQATSPIRRYPDLLAHRALRACISSDHVMLGSPAALEPAATLSSQRERRAMEAEREVARIAGILLMKPHVGETFDGTVTGVDRVGYWVELDEFFVEGFVPVGRLPEYYQFVSERVELQSRTSSRAIRLGDRARVVVVAADIGERRLDFAPAETA